MKPGLVQENEQPAACLLGFWAEVQEGARRYRAELRAIPEIVAWLRAHPHKDDTGNDPGRRIPGCEPPQRTEWLATHLNCWERAMHFLAWHVANDREVGIYEIRDSELYNNRHILIIDRRTGQDLSLAVMPDATAAQLSQSLGAARRAAANFDLGAVVKGAGTGAAIGSAGGVVGAGIGAAVGGVLTAADEILQDTGITPRQKQDVVTRSIGDPQKPAVTVQAGLDSKTLLLLGALALLLLTRGKT